MRQKLKIFFSRFLGSSDFKKASRKSFVIIANNCWGAEVYKRYGKPYNTPFVGLFLYGEDYLKLISNFQYYINLPLSFVPHSSKNPNATYPIGKLGDIEIHFMHYKDEEHATSNWNRRLERMKKITNEDDYYFRLCDNDGNTKQMIEAFHQLPLKNKISFGIMEIDHPHHYTMTERRGEEQCVPDGLQQFRVMGKYFDIDQWIAS